MKVYTMECFIDGKIFKTKELAEEYCDINYKDYPFIKESIKEKQIIESLEKNEGNKSLHNYSNER